MDKIIPTKTCGSSAVTPIARASLSEEFFTKGLMILTTHFPSLLLTDARVAIWREMLGDLTEAQFIRGVRAFCLSHREIYPGTNVIANIRHYALTDPKRPTASEAWELVLREIHHAGSYEKPKFDDPLIAKAVACIGWSEICRSEQIGVERAHFLRAYDELVERERFNAVAGMKD